MMLDSGATFYLFMLADGETLKRQVVGSTIVEGDLSV